MSSFAYLTCEWLFSATGYAPSSPNPTESVRTRILASSNTLRTVTQSVKVPLQQDARKFSQVFRYCLLVDRLGL